MKKLMICIGLLIVAAVLRPNMAQAQADEIAQLVLNIKKLSQFKKILKNMKDGYEILNNGYNTVRGIAQGNYTIHKTYLDGLLNVSPAVRNYKRVSDIIGFQGRLLKEYRAAYSRFASDQNFTAEEMAYMAHVYDRLLKSSMRNLEELTQVMTSGKMRMSDSERLETIDRIFADMEAKLHFLRAFNNDTSILALQRAKEKRDVQTVRKVYFGY